MPAAPFPPRESERLEALRSTGTLDTPPEAPFDRVAALAARLCNTPVALVSLVDEERQWFKARVGLDTPETPRDVAFCAHAILDEGLLIVPDARHDPRFVDNALVWDDPNVVFYAGMPIRTRAGHALGTLCVIDHVPRTLEPWQREALEALGGQLAAEFDLRARTRELEATNAELNALLEGSPLVVIRASPDGVLRSVNPFGAALLGLEDVRASLPDLVTAPDRPSVSAVLERLQDHGEKEPFSAAFVGANGESLWLEGTACVPRPGVREICFALSDVTSLRRTANELDGYFSLSLDMLCVAGTDGYFQRLNPVWETTLGHPLDDLRSRPFLTFVHPDDRAATAAEVERVARGGTTVSFVCRFRTASGGYRSLMWSAVASSELPLLFAAARDITDQLATEAALRSSEAHLRGVLEAAVDGIATCDDGGTLLTVNPAVERIFGWSAAELVGRQAALLLAPSERERWAPMVARYRATGDVGIIGSGADTIGVRKDGTAFEMYVAVGEVAGPPRQFTAVLRDISQRKAAERSLREQTEALAVATQQANAANRLKSEFLANMSHELRTPLNGILGFARLLHDGEAGPVTEDQVEFLGHIVTSGEHLLQLINDVLDLAKVESGKLSFYPVDTDVSRVVSEVFGILRELAARKRIAMVTDLADDLPTLFLDPARLKQVLYNYLSNAIKFTPPDGRVTLRVRVEAGGFVRFEVEDTGIGIRREDIGRVFAEFVQLEQDAAKTAGGTGLGLALTRRLVQDQGGEVGLTSEPGVGSTFYALLPIRTAPPPPPDAPDPEIPEPGAPVEGARVLVVEDEPVERAWLRRTLGRAGYRVDTATTGAEAVQRAASCRYDAMTLDLYLPDMAGWEVLKAVRATALNATVPTVLVTVQADPHLAVADAIGDLLPERTTATVQAVVLKGAGSSEALLDALRNLQVPR